MEIKNGNEMTIKLKWQEMEDDDKHSVSYIWFGSL
jgi:hypothetical protein